MAQQRYHVIERIDAGGMAEVFKANATSLQGFEKLVAIKRILPNLAKNERFIRMFLDEAKLSLHLSHTEKPLGLQHAPCGVTSAQGQQCLGLGQVRLGPRQRLGCGLGGSRLASVGHRLPGGLDVDADGCDSARGARAERQHEQPEASL